MTEPTITACKECTVVSSSRCGCRTERGLKARGQVTGASCDCVLALSHDAVTATPGACPFSAGRIPLQASPPPSRSLLPFSPSQPHPSQLVRSQSLHQRHQRDLHSGSRLSPGVHQSWQPGAWDPLLRRTARLPSASSASCTTALVWPQPPARRAPPWPPLRYFAPGAEPEASHSGLFSALLASSSLSRALTRLLDLS